MRRNLLFKQLVVLLFASTCWLSCQNEDNVGLSQSQEEPNFITENYALKLLESFTPQQAPSRSTANSQSLKKEVNEFTPVKDENGKIIFYIANYEGGGFAILAADNRVEPILAYSDDSEFRTDIDDFPSGLVEWLVLTKETVQSVRAQNIGQSLAIKQEWDNMALQSVAPVDTLDREEGWQPCPSQYWEVGPLLTTTWSQTSGFSSLLPAISCSGYNQPPYAGCVPIAIAQVMKYHSYPPSYSWASMPNGYASGETARLIRDIHSVVPVNYYCDGTGVSHDYNVANAFSYFGYSPAIKADYSYETVISELNKGRPVILAGGRKSGWWIFSSYKDGHMWVCDGYSKYTHWYDCESGYTSIFLRMNWGWVNGMHNGWFSVSNFNPGNSTYNYDVKMVYNIKP